MTREQRRQLAQYLAYRQVEDVDPTFVAEYLPGGATDEDYEAVTFYIRNASIVIGDDPEIEDN